MRMNYVEIGNTCKACCYYTAHPELLDSETKKNAFERIVKDFEKAMREEFENDETLIGYAKTLLYKKVLKKRSILKKFRPVAEEVLDDYLFF